MPISEMLLAFDRQTDALLTDAYCTLLDMDSSRIFAALQPLRERLEALPAFGRQGNIPICISFGPGMFSADTAMTQIRAKGASGRIDMFPCAPQDFKPIDIVTVPAVPFYLLIDVDTGRDSLNVSPENAIEAIRAQGRTPLTLEEGVCLTLQFPMLLTDKTSYNCIQMPGSRRSGDQRIASIWFSKGAPRLGWCWNRNIHTWLGSASAAYRLGPEA